MAWQEFQRRLLALTKTPWNMAKSEEARPFDVSLHQYVLVSALC